jgi:hypothetical protein
MMPTGFMFSIPSLCVLALYASGAITQSANAQTQCPQVPPAINATPPPATNADFSSNPAPTLTMPSSTTAVLHKELNGYSSYGAVDAAADILYGYAAGTRNAATWTFTLPSSIQPSQVRSACFVAQMVGAGSTPAAFDQNLGVWTNGVFIFDDLSGLPSAITSNTSPPIIQNWKPRTFGSSVSQSGAYSITMANLGPPTANAWFAVDWIELHLILNAPTFSITDFQIPISGVLTAVKSPAPVQVVFNPHASTTTPPSPDLGPFDLVLGKATAFLVGLKVDQPNLVPSRGVELQLTFGTSPPFPSVFVIPQCPVGQTMNCFQPDGTATALINTGFKPQSIGSNVVVSVTVNPGDANHIDEGDGSMSGKSASVNVNVIATKTPELAYIPINDCFGNRSCYGPLTSFAQSVNSGSQLVTATYPVPSVTSDVDTTPLAGNPDTTRSSPDADDDAGINADFLAVGSLAKKLYPFAKKAIAIVPQKSNVLGNSYFGYHGFGDYVGLSANVGAFVALVQEGDPSTVTHELGHLMGIKDEEYQYGVTDFTHQCQTGFTGTPPLCLGNQAVGFNVAAGQLISDSCFMGEGAWVDNQHYTFLFGKTSNGSDPPLLLITAFLHKDGSVELQPWYALPDGLATESMPGNYMIRSVDVTGQTVSELSMPVEFVLHADPVGVFPRDTVPLIVTIPYLPRASSIAILNNGQVVGQVQIASKLLADAVMSIPDGGFTMNASQRRGALLNKIAAFDTQLATQAIRGASNNLQNDIRKSLQDWLLDGYAVPSPLQYTKIEILSLVDDLLMRLGAQQ